MSEPGSGEYPPKVARTETRTTRYAESIFESLPAVEVGVEVPRAAVTRLTDGKDAELKLSAQEAVERQGWSAEAVARARKGAPLINLSGQVFEVVGGDKHRLQVRDAESGEEGTILFEPRAMKAHEYAYQLGAGSRAKTIRVYDAAYKDRSLDTSAFLDSIMASVPAQCLDVFDEVRILRMENSKAGKFKAEPSLISSKKSITLYVDAEGYPTQETVQTFYHELGHAIAKHLKGEVNPGKRWKTAMAADGNSVSEYSAKTRYPKQGDQGEIEDFADTVMMYLSTDGAKINATQALRDFCASRFQKLDEVFEDLARSQSRNTLARHLFRPSSR